MGIYFRDISDRKLAEEQLLLTQNRLQYLLSSNPAILYACEASGDYAATFISENVSAMLGYQSHDFLADSRFWANQIHPEDLERVFAGLAHLFDVGRHTHEYRFRHQDGSYRWVLDELKLISDSAGNPVEIVGYWIDITDRKQAEQKIREQANLLAIATDAIFVYDLDHRIVFWNQGAEKLYGWRSPEIIGQDWRQLLDLDALPEITAGREHLIQQGAWQGELILVVDDEVAIQEITKATLETHGYQAITANDGIEAIALYAEHKQKIGVVLLDLMMPLLDSTTIIRTLYRLNPQVQIVAMSGLATNESVMKMTAEGVKAFLAKPFTAPELLHLLSQLCAGDR